MLIKYIVFITSGFKTIQVTLSNAQITQVRIYGEPYAHKFSAIDHPSSSNITHCQVLSHARAWFNDSAGELIFMKCFLATQNQLFYIKV